MESDSLRIQMLGDFSISRGDLSVSGGRSRKVWLLLAYLIWNRDRPVSEEELTELLWQTADPGQGNALKTLLHRARAALEPLAPAEKLILRQEDGWIWNRQIPLCLDAEAFSRLRQTKGEPAADLEDRLQALALYQGPFLPQLAGRPWRDALSSQLRDAFLETALEVLPQLTARRRWQEAADLSRKAAEETSLTEAVYLFWMESLLALERREEAASVYETLREKTLSQLGTLPSSQAQALYRKARQNQSSGLLTPDALLEQLREPESSGGAYFCDFDFFKAVCQTAARDMARTKLPAHLALLSAAGENASPQSLRLAVDHLREVVRTQLRRGDVASLCGAAQIVCLLPRADYENSCKAADRVMRAFVRQYPHAPVRLRAEIVPLSLV